MKLTRQAFTLAFKELAVKQVNGSQSVEMACKELGLGDQTFRNWVKRRQQADWLVQVTKRQCRSVTQQSEIWATEGSLKNERTSFLFSPIFCNCSCTRSCNFSPFIRGFLATPVRLAWLQTSSSGLRSGA